MRLRLKGYFGYWKDNSWIEDKSTILCENQSKGISKSIEARFISKDKIKEMEEFGFAYTNKPSVYLI